MRFIDSHHGTRGRLQGFTLIELLIVVAIIAILAAIAVPNFLEAQVRSKVSRVKNDMRTLDTGLTSYYTDTNRYPTEPAGGDPVALHTLIKLTTPVAYLTSIAGTARDPFITYFGTNRANGTKYFLPTFFYCEYTTFGYIRAGVHTYDWKGWGLASHGPDAYDDGILWAGYLVKADPASWVKNGLCYNMVYDPSNGTVSLGDISRWGGEVPSDVLRMVGYNK